MSNSQLFSYLNLKNIYLITLEIHESGGGGISIRQSNKLFSEYVLLIVLKVITGHLGDIKWPLFEISIVRRGLFRLNKQI